MSVLDFNVRNRFLIDSFGGLEEFEVATGKYYPDLLCEELIIHPVRVRDLYNPSPRSLDLRQYGYGLNTKYNLLDDRFNLELSARSDSGLFGFSELEREWAATKKHGQIAYLAFKDKIICLCFIRQVSSREVTLDYDRLRKTSSYESKLFKYNLQIQLAKPDRSKYLETYIAIVEGDWTQPPDIKTILSKSNYFSAFDPRSGASILNRQDFWFFVFDKNPNALEISSDTTRIWELDNLVGKGSDRIATYDNKLFFLGEGSFARNNISSTRQVDSLVNARVYLTLPKASERILLSPIELDIYLSESLSFQSLSLTNLNSTSLTLTPKALDNYNASQLRPDPIIASNYVPTVLNLNPLVLQPPVQLDIQLNAPPLNIYSPPGTVVGVFTTTGGPAGSTYTYTLLVNPESLFSIVGNQLILTGLLLALEEVEQFYYITVRSTIGSSQTNVTEVFTIVISEGASS